LSLGASAARAGQGYAYVGDYAGSQVVRFDDTTGAPISPTPYIPLSHAEGVGGTNTVLAVASGDGFINLYDISKGAAPPPLIRTINTPGFSGLRIAFSPDGSKLYAGGTINYPAPGQIREYDFATGTELGHINTPDGSWGVAVNQITGQVAYTTGWATGSGGAVYGANADLSGAHVIVAPGDHGITGLVGITFTRDGQSFYVVNGGNGDPLNSFVNHYRADGTFIDRVSEVGMPSGALNNAFDTEIGPNGNLFVTSQNGACVVEFNTKDDTYNSIFIPPHAGGLAQAKTLHFSVNSVPEPSSLALLGLGGAALLGRRAAAARARRAGA
jgi:hypothetical protein